MLELLKVSFILDLAADIIPLIGDADDCPPVHTLCKPDGCKPYQIGCTPYDD